jgi:hypothetical protein
MNKAERLFEKIAVHASETMSFPTRRSANLKQCMCGAGNKEVRHSEVKTAICRRYNK